MFLSAKRGEDGLSKKQLVREMKAAALARMEDAARTVGDFQAIVKQWNHLDRNRERRERNHEIGRPNEEMLHWDRINSNDEKGRLKSKFDAVISRPLEHPWWRQLIQGDFIDTIYDHFGEIWQLVEDPDISLQLKALSDKQKIVVFLSVIRQCTPQQIACYQDKTDRAIRKLLATALDNMRDQLAPIIRGQINAGEPDMTLKKRQFIERFDKQKIALDKDKGER